MNKKPSVSVVVPAFNEEQNLKNAITSIVDALKVLGVDWEIILVNDGSTDSTPQIAKELAGKEPRIRVLNHVKPMGIGYSFRDGILNATKEAVTMLPGDGENDPYEVLKYLPLIEHVDFVVPFVINKEVRSKIRQFLSAMYLVIINLSFGTNFNYTNGNVIYRRSVFDKIEYKSNGFFYQTECIVKAKQAGFTFAEVPILIRSRLKGQSKALSWKSFKALAKDYLRLLFAVNF